MSLLSQMISSETRLTIPFFSTVMTYKLMNATSTGARKAVSLYKEFFPHINPMQKKPNPIKQRMMATQYPIVLGATNMPTTKSTPPNAYANCGFLLYKNEKINSTNKIHERYQVAVTPLNVIIEINFGIRAETNPLFRSNKERNIEKRVSKTK